MFRLHFNRPDFDIEWAILKGGLTDIFDGRTLERKHVIELYSHLFHICVNSGIQTYEELKQLISDHVSRIFRQYENMDGLKLLSIYDENWKKFRIGSEGVNHVCYYLNRDYIKKEQDEGNENVYSIHELCFVIWKDAFHHTGTEIRITNAILDLIRQERTGSNINYDIIKDVLQSYVELSIHVECFENRFLQTTADHYREEAKARKIETLPRAEYLDTVDKWITDEAARYAHYLDPSPKLQKIMENVLIKPFFLSQILAQIQSKQFFDKGLSDDWTRVHSLIDHDDKLVEIQEALVQHFTREGLEAIERAKETIGQDTMLYVAKLQEVVQQQSDLVKQAFNNYNDANGALDKAAEIYVNKNAVTTNKLPGMLAKYCDELLKKSVRTDNEFDVLLDQAVLLFKYLEDKDMFLKIYTKSFIKRLIEETSASEEAEYSFIRKLTSSCDFEYTKQMRTMLYKANISKNLTSGFRQTRSAQNNDLPGLRVFIIGSRSTGSPTNFRLPSNVDQCIDEFTRFYNNKYGELTWMLSLSRGELLCNAFESTKIFVATAAQIAVLMLYNESLKYTAKSIGDSLQMDKKTTSQTIALLIKSKVLLGKMTENGGKDDDVKEISLNQEYNNRKYKIDLTSHSESKSNWSNDVSRNSSRRNM